MVRLSHTLGQALAFPDKKIDSLISLCRQEVVKLVYIASYHVWPCIVSLTDESKLVNTLPVKMKADLAIHTHLETLSKVALLRVSWCNSSYRAFLFFLHVRIVRRRSCWSWFSNWGHFCSYQETSFAGRYDAYISHDLHDFFYPTYLRRGKLVERCTLWTKVRCRWWVGRTTRCWLSWELVLSLGRSSECQVCMHACLRVNYNVSFWPL